jgi:nitroimidazol reductase NimA-like FMN-containing flavoprotein (pyridoxamine 5'-phosphate oxidase superfamily)
VSLYSDVRKPRDAIMIINQMTEPECRELLQRAQIGRLACALDNQPYVVPVYFAYEAEYMYIHSTLGQKIEWMRANPKVCIQVDEISNESKWASVVVNGFYQELPEPRYAVEREHARKLLERRHRWWVNALAERRLLTSDRLIAPLFFRIHIDSMTGLRAEPEGEAGGGSRE